MDNNSSLWDADKIWIGSYMQGISGSIIGLIRILQFCMSTYTLVKYVHVHELRTVIWYIVYRVIPSSILWLWDYAGLFHISSNPDVCEQANHHRPAGQAEHAC